MQQKNKIVSGRSVSGDGGIPWCHSCSKQKRLTKLFPACSKSLASSINQSRGRVAYQSCQVMDGSSKFTYCYCITVFYAPRSAECTTVKIELFTLWGNIKMTKIYSDNTKGTFFDKGGPNTSIIGNHHQHRSEGEQKAKQIFLKASDEITKMKTFTKSHGSLSSRCNPSKQQIFLQQSNLLLKEER